jgi:hypothetical protein
MKINPNKSKAISFTIAQGEDPLNYFLRNQNISEANFCKCLRIIILSDLSWAEHVNYTVKKALRAIYFIMHNCKRGK